MSLTSVRRIYALALTFSILALLQGCAGVTVSNQEPREYLAQRRADVLTHGQLSAATRESLRIIGSDAKPCLVDAPACRAQLASGSGLGDERRLSALAELWTFEALQQDKLRRSGSDKAYAANAAWMEAARYAWAYLFLTGKEPGKRAFEDRQTQVRDYYNFAVQQAITGLFEAQSQFSDGLPGSLAHVNGDQLRWRDWTFAVDASDIHQPTQRQLPRELIAASSLSFSGLRNTYRRDGFGAELVAVFAQPDPSSEAVYEEARFPAITTVLAFEGDTLDAVLRSQHATVRLYDPYRRSEISLARNTVPLAGNFTSGYGLWLARSEFSTQALRTLLGRERGITRPRIHLMQPYDPNRRVIVMLHGLASSPEAWINVANEVLGEEALRRNYQIWQVYYPTNAPIPLNNRNIRKALEETLQHFDPAGTATASKRITLVGHSMGGVLARLMVTDTKGHLVDSMAAQLKLSASTREQVQGELNELLEFSAVPQVSNAVFIAAPHRGTDFANHRIARWASNLITLPFSMVESFAKAATHIERTQPQEGRASLHIPNSIDNLSDRDPFVRATAQLSIAPGVRFHTIIGNNTPDKPLLLSSDGIVPYSSAHWDGAESELVIASGHSVQETPPAIIELRRILRGQLAKDSTFRRADGGSGIEE
ncbi:esterase/lipase family protein [Diaphorobacter caeni]|uniref:esterase/lipase family protein n=1 Tax=Diaphorobacter caeni TaxID=2784387 RepID=UPI00188E8A74|nr:alpha/beta fold hydrolase [Diaphorobacter caeni]MBF5005728.1 alpha/beta fold hydrolase [Diaphorobacter caeni]